MDDFAQPADVTGVSGALTPAQTAAIPGLIEQASTLLRGWGIERGIDVDALVSDNQLREKLAKVAVVNAVKRALPVLDGAVETSFAEDDYRETIRFHQDQLTAGLFISDADLTGFLPGKRQKIGMLRMGRAL